MTERVYTIDHQEPTSYIDTAGNVINGYLISGTIVKFDEGFQLQVPNLDANTVDRKIKELVAAREKLAGLGAA